MKNIFCIISLLFFSYMASPQTPAFVSDSLDTYILKGLKDWDVPGLSIVIVKDGKPVIMKGYGVKNVETQQQVDQNTLFMIASNTKQAIDIYRRNLQKAYVERLIRVANPEPVTTAIVFPGASPAVNSRTSDVMSIAKMGLRSLQAEIRGALPAYKDAMSRAHLQDVNDRITAALDPTK